MTLAGPGFYSDFLEIDDSLYCLRDLKHISSSALSTLLYFVYRRTRPR